MQWQSADELGLDSYARMDFLLNENNEMFCLEANTLPGDDSYQPASAGGSRDWHQV